MNLGGLVILLIRRSTDPVESKGKRRYLTHPGSWVPAPAFSASDTVTFFFWIHVVMLSQSCQNFERQSVRHCIISSTTLIDTLHYLTYIEGPYSSGVQTNTAH